MTTSTTHDAVGRFQLLEILGTSGLSTTYKALDSASGTPVVVRVLSDYFRGEPETVRRFFQHIEPTIGMQHENILPLIEAGQDARHAWLVTAFEDAPTLQQQPHGMTLGKALGILHGVAQALDYSWLRGVQHGDLKPTNIFVNDAGLVLVSDFGMGALAETAHLLIRSTLSTPHPCYSAPELAGGFKSGHAADEYSLACIAYELLTGEVPFYALDASTVLAKQMSNDPVGVSEKNHTLPAALDPVFHRALGRRPEQRYSSASEFVRVLEATLGAADRNQALPDRMQMFESAKSAPRMHVTAPAPQAQPSTPLPTKLCPQCGAENVEGKIYCIQCWTRLENKRGATRDEVRAMRQKVVWELRRRRLLVATVAAVLLLALAGRIWWQIIGPNPFLDPPTSQIAVVAPPGDWPMTRRDTNHSAIAVGAAPLKGETVWTFKTAEPYLSSPAVVGNRVYSATGDRRMVALDRDTGAVIWEVPMSGPIDSSPAIAGGLLFVGLRDRAVICLDTETGKTKWSFMTGNPISTGPVVANGTVYVSSGDGNLYAIDALTGIERWHHPYDGFLLSSPVVSGDAVIAVNPRGVLHVLDAISGRHRLAYDIRASVWASPVLDGDKLYLASMNGIVHAMYWTPVEYPLERGWLKWKQYMVAFKMISGPIPTQKGHIWGATFRRVPFSTSPIVTEDTLYLTSSVGSVFALNKADGTVRWRKELGESVTASPVMVGNLLYILTKAGKLIALNPATGAPNGSPVQIGIGANADLVAAGGLLFVSGLDGTLYAVR